MRLSTSRCAAAGHPEISIEIAVPFASTASWLVGYFEEQVAAGRHFEVNQTVEIGWSLIQLRKADEYLEVWEPDFDAMPIRWCQGASNTLRQLTLQHSICEILRSNPLFPSIRHAGIISPNFLACNAFTMSRDRPSESDSGWVFREQGYAGSEGEFVSLYQIALATPRIIPFLAAPEATWVNIEPGVIEVGIGDCIASSRDTPLLRQLENDPILI
jgi:hypothetical protein